MRRSQLAPVFQPPIFAAAFCLKMMGSRDKEGAKSTSSGSAMTVLVGKTSDYLGPFKILLVEPNPLMRKVTRNILQLLGARRIIDLGDINQAVAFLEQGDVDIVLSEWYLQDACGLDLVRWVRCDASDVKFTPFIMVTSQTRVQNIVMARNCGITEFVAKPFSAKSLIARIREVVERPRPFVSIGQYFGPDRRRRADALSESRNRRNQDSLLINGKDLTQEQINHLISSSKRGRFP